MKDGKFLEAAEKEKIYETFVRFVESGYNPNIFTKALYSHLSLNFSFIAHYNKGGFYQARFSTASSRGQTFLQILGASRWNFVDDNTSGNADLNTAIRDYVLKNKDKLLEASRQDRKKEIDEQISRLQSERDYIGG